MPGPTKELREEVIIAISSRYPALKKLFGVKKIGIFGSLARGDEHPGSDIDIEVEFEKGSDTYRNYFGLALYLEELLGGRRVDLVTTRVLEGYLHADVAADHAEKNRDRVYISRMLEEMVFLLERKKNLGFREFSHDDLMKRAAIRSLEIIGDGAARMSEATKKAYPGIPWRELAGMKDRLAGMYFSPDWVLVWDILAEEIPAVEPRLRSLAASL
jgi:uncharacterized protein with HEPN domain/predicted nucleotidyltransferase